MAMVKGSVDEWQWWVAMMVNGGIGDGLMLVMVSMMVDE